MKQTWRQHAACRGIDPDIFYPLDEDDDGEGAKQVCLACPVRQACLEHALTSRETEGVWGGASERERRRMLRHRRRSA
ncbi:WhiB family transcriptional regulator [soil metagenome]|jgi:WhiB family redox-sensing transcriptional regulator|nr:WhiB family transcriptional regulator [Acidimicrobiia bacterium]